MDGVVVGQKRPRKPKTQQEATQTGGKENKNKKLQEQRHQAEFVARVPSLRVAHICFNTIKERESDRETFASLG